MSEHEKHKTPAQQARADKEKAMADKAHADPAKAAPAPGSPRIGDPVDPNHPGGARWGDAAHPVPGAKYAPGGIPLERTDPESEDAPWVPQVGDTVRLKSGGPAMTVLALDAPGMVAAPGVAMPGATVQCQWFAPSDHTQKQGSFPLAVLVECECEDDKPWVPQPPK